MSKEQGDTSEIVEENIFSFKDTRTGFDPFLSYQGDRKAKPEEFVIVMDNGSFQCRLGWHDSANFTESSYEAQGLVYKNVMAKTRKEKGKEAELHVANDIINIEAVRFNLKTPFDRNVVTQFEHQETLLDYGFAHLGIDNQDAIPHPIVITEPLGNPSSCRASMNELLFECYSVPKVAYGVDCLFSFSHNKERLGLSDTSLIISFGFHTIHLVPVINGKVDSFGIRRINIGGFHLINYLHRALQLKYPTHTNNITVGRAEEMLYDHCYVSSEFMSDLRKWNDLDYYQQNVHKMQLPFTPAPKAPPVDPEILRLRRQELAKRLVEINAKKREEKLQEDEILVKTLLSAKSLYEQGYDDKVKKMLAKFELVVKNEADLDQVIAKTRGRIEKAKLAILRRRDELLFPTLNKKDEPEAKKRRQDMDDEEGKMFDTWMEEIKLKRQELLDRRAARHLRKQQLAKRRTAASQERMRMISQLAKNSKKDDNFGMRDEDWEVYKKISKDDGVSDSEEEQEKLTEYEAALKEHDPNFGSSEEQEIKHDSAEWYQLHLATERIRVPEILFQPSIVGHDQAGVSETLEFILKKYSPEVQDKLVLNIFLTGALCQIPGLEQRLETDLREMRPFESDFRVSVASNPSLDAWRGAQNFARENIDQDKYFITKSDYEELGPDILREHFCSNKFIPTPELVLTEEV